MQVNKSFSFIEFQRSNSGKNISGIDYVRAVYATTPLHFDFLIHYAQLLSPTIKVVDGRAFIGELFDADRHLELVKTIQDTDQAQYWMNLLEITGLFDDLTTEQAIALAQTISECWNRKLFTEHGSSYGEARYIFDTDSDEVFVTIARLPHVNSEEP